MDLRLQTFLTLCRTMHYRRAADELHLTQPAVTRQIQKLEQEYGAKLFSYDGRRLEKTEAGRLLERYAASLRAQEDELRQALAGREMLRLRIGATKTVGDYALGRMTARYLRNPQNGLELTVDNTARLLRLLEQNELDFAIVEGLFDTKRYASRLFRQEPFYGICAQSHPFAGRAVGWDELVDETLLEREPGSGTRLVFERELARLGYATEAFRRRVTISSFALIKTLVAAGVGVTFAYRALLTADDGLATFSLGGEEMMHAFQFVYLPHTRAADLIDVFLQGE